MKNAVNAFCSLALLTVCSCALSALYTVFSLVEGVGDFDAALGLWLCCLYLCYITLNIFLRRERSLRSVITVCVLFFALQSILAFILYGMFSGFLGILIALCMWAYTYFTCFEISTVRLDAEKLNKGFDLCAMVLVFVLFYCSVWGMSLALVLPLAGAVLLCLIALMLLRSENGVSAKSLFLAVCIIGVSGLVSGLVVMLAGGGIKKLTLFIMETALAIGRLAAKIINAVFLFLIELFPEAEYELLPEEAAPSLPGGGMEGSMELGNPQLVMGLIIGAGLLLVLFILVYKLVFGKTRMKAVSTVGSKGISRSRTGLGEVLKRMIKKLYSRLCFAAKALMQRNTAPGLFLQIEKRSRGKLHGRGKSESCREFLCRAAGLYPHAEEELKKLGDAMDGLCFGFSQGLSRGEVIAMRKMIFKSVKR